MDDMDLTLFEDPDVICPNATFLEPSVLIPSIHDVNVLNNQLNQLSVDMNTQDLRSRLERPRGSG